MVALEQVLTCISFAGAVGTVLGTTYGFRQTTIIKTLDQSNKAYFERNQQLEDAYTRLMHESAGRIGHLEGRVHTLESLKTPSLEPLMHIVEHNHKQVMTMLNDRSQLND